MIITIHELEYYEWCHICVLTLHQYINTVCDTNAQSQWNLYKTIWADRATLGISNEISFGISSWISSEISSEISSGIFSENSYEINFEISTEVFTNKYMDKVGLL